jgi:Tol biopolymer transport system component
MSSDGRFVAFDSLASNLVEGDNNGMRDVFTHDRETGETTRISEVVYGDRIEEANESSGDARISGNGRYVAFTSGANNLDPNYDSYPLGHSNIYIHDRQTGQNRIISFQPDGSQHPSGAMAPDISDDGSFIAYATGIELPPEGIAPVEGDYTTWVHDTTTGTTSQVAEFNMTAPHVHVSPPSVTPDGSLAVVSGREGGTFVFERETSSIRELPSFPDVASLIPFPDGERFAFWSSAPLVPDDLNQSADAFVYDRSTGEVTMLMAEARPLSISSDGRFVAVIENEESGGPVLVLDTQDGGTGQLSGAPGGPTNVELSGDGAFATFSTTAELVGGDSNGKQDVFVMDLEY